MIHFRTSQGMTDLADLKPRDLAPEAIGDALAKINRYSGRTPAPWPVAAHSIVVAMLCSPAARAWGLMHDAHEALIGDLTTPALELFCAYGTPVGAAVIRNAIRRSKEGIDAKLVAQWQINVTPAIRDEVHRADKIACQAEMFVLMGAEVAIPEADQDDLERAITHIRDLESAHDWRVAKRLWLDFARDLGATGQLYAPGLTQAPTTN